MDQQKQQTVPEIKVDMANTLVEHWSMLVNIASSVTGCRSRAEDVVQDVFLKVAEQRSMELICRPLAYLVRMVRNLAIDHYRRQSFERGHYGEEDDGIEIPSHWGEPETHTINCDMLRRIANALASLPVRTQSAFEMVRLKDMTLKEAACQLDVSQTMVHFMVRDATSHCLATVGPHN